MTTSDRSLSLADRLVLEAAETTAAIEIIEDSQAIHAKWVEYINRGSVGRDVIDVAGDVQHHEDCIRRYDTVLHVLRRWQLFQRRFLVDLGLLLSDTEGGDPT